MDRKIQNTGLALADDPIADGKRYFTFAEARRCLGCSPASSGNLLKRMLAARLIDRVRHGHYVVRQLGVLGTPCVAEAIVAGGSRVDAERLSHYARRLGWTMALRRIGSIADALEVAGLAGRLRPFRPIRPELDLEPGAPAPHAWRDTRWHLRWPQPVDEIRAVAHQ